ncbi:hypothetical protein ASF43_09360 [Pseudorhodoferax sp. Leaf267]|nr:hypothetical protein ASF43_09360 [Pseudorhodoferax sp. Leaf267]
MCLPCSAQPWLVAALLCLGALPCAMLIAHRWVTVEVTTTPIGDAAPPLSALALAGACALAAALLLYCQGLRRAAAARRARAQEAQAARLRTLGLLEAIAQCTTELMVAKDMEGRYTFYNHAAAKTFGRKADEILGRTNIDIFGPEMGARLGRDDAQVLRTLQPTVFDEEMPTPDGSVTLQYTKSPLFDEAGQLIGLLMVARDVSEKRRLQADLQTHRQQLESKVSARTLQLTMANEALERAVRFNRTITDALPGRVAYFDRSRHCLFANRLYAEWFGHTVESVVGLSTQEIAGPHHERLRGPLHAALAGEPQSYERDTVLPDGSLHCQQVHIVPDIDAQGEVHGALLMSFDITELKQTERALTCSNAQLQASRDRAEAASRAKSVFLANMSHEIRTPLNAVIGMTHLMAMDAAPGRQRDRLATVDTAARHLLRILNDILDLSKIEAGTLRLDDEPFSLHAVVRQATELLEASVHHKGLDMQVQAAQLPDRVQGDATRLSQMLSNLLSNAIKFTEAGRIRLHASVAATDGARVQLRFEVDDTGVGVAPERRATLFNNFEQGDGSTTRVHGGTGLGLALTRQLAQAMGGEAGYRPNATRGSTFWVTAWLTSTDHATALPTAPAPAPDPLDQAIAQLRRRHAGQCVLLAEDNPVNQEVARNLLALAGLRVDVAEDGEHAVRMAAAGGYDLVLMDLEMPRMDGLAAARALRAQGLRIPLVAMTGHAAADSVDSGLDDHLAKPVNPLALYETLLRWLPAPPDAGS